MVVTSRVVVMVIGQPFAGRCGCVDLGEEHRDDAVGEPDPTVAARVVGHLLVGDARDEGGEEVHVGLVGDAGRRESGARPIS